MIFKSKEVKQLEKQLMLEIKELAGVDEFPYEDAKEIAELIAAYSSKRANAMVDLKMMSALDTLEKYNRLADAWDDTMIKYKKLGLFPHWNIII